MFLIRTKFFEEYENKMQSCLNKSSKAGFRLCCFYKLTDAGETRIYLYRKLTLVLIKAFEINAT